MYTETLRVLSLWADLSDAQLADLDGWLRTEYRATDTAQTLTLAELTYGIEIIATVRQLRHMDRARIAAGGVY